MANGSEKTVKATLKNINISPRKVRLVADLIRGQNATSALAQLKMTNKRGSEPLEKLINSALANARNQNLDQSRLVVDTLTVDKGLTFKRALPKSRGRVGLVERKFSHVNLVLKEADSKAPKYVIHKKEKKIKDIKPEQIKPKKQQDFKEAEKKPKKEKKPGFMKKIFQRKSI